jgi:hypothetical protein
VVLWYIFPVLVCCSKKNLASLIAICRRTFPDAIAVFVAGGKSGKLFNFSSTDGQRNLPAKSPHPFLPPFLSADCTVKKLVNRF